jgi:hypothetical protein
MEDPYSKLQNYFHTEATKVIVRKILTGEERIE